MQPSSKVLSGLMGVCVGDALGVPVEFSSRAARILAPVTTMFGYGTHNQPPGTWSDDSSLTFCLAESLCQGFDTDAIAHSFCRWFEEGYWTPHGLVFDIGNTTRRSLQRLQQGIPPLEAGDRRVSSNGNGSLMRILPLAYYHKTLDFSELLRRVDRVSSITHGHILSQFACEIYISIAIYLLQGHDPKFAYFHGLQQVKEVYAKLPNSLPTEMADFERVFSGEIESLPIDAIFSDGYVIHTLEAALWCLLNSSSYTEAVLKAVNLGEDTDTTAAVTGGLAGIYYGFENIPKEWVEQIARKEDIIVLANRLEAALYKSV